jgi:hypothetical protein
MSGFIEALSQRGVGSFADFGVKVSQNHPFLRMNLAFAGSLRVLRPDRSPSTPIITATPAPKKAKPPASP